MTTALVIFIFVLTAVLARMTTDALIKRARSYGRLPNNQTPGGDQTEIRAGTAKSDVLPDYGSPIIAYRAWEWDGSNLRSLNNHDSWLPNQPFAAECSGAAGWHLAPHETCACGVYAAKGFDQLRKLGYT
jgi:hypothetical protein